MNGPRTQPTKTERDLFLEALERPTPDERTAFLDEACASDPSLRAAVEALLQNHREDGFLESPALVVPHAAASTRDRSGTDTHVVIGERPGNRVGSYRLLQQIGEGGVGVVFMAEQEAPVRRRVALKVLKPGMSMVFAASAYGAGGGLVKLSKEANGGVKAEEVYATRKMQNHHGGMILLDGCLYGANGGNEGGFLICLDFKTGNVLWDGRDDPERRAPKGSVALADGRLYYRTEKGTVLLIEPKPKEYVERGRFEQPDRSRLPAWAHPVIANGKLYVRDQDVLFCYDVKAK